MKQKAVFIIGFILLASLVGFWAWQQSASRVSTNEPRVAIENRPTDPNKTEMKNQLVSGFPEFPVYPGATVENSTRMKQASGTKGYTTVWLVKGTGENVLIVTNWYRDALIDEGWQIEYISDPQELEQLIHARKNNERVTVNVEIHTADQLEIMVDFPLTYQ